MEPNYQASKQKEDKQPMATATNVLKRELRERMKTALRSLPRNVIVEESAQASAILTSDERWKRARTVALYASMEAEFDTSSLIRNAFDCGKRVFLPRVIDKKLRVMRMLETKAAEWESLPMNNWGIRQPPLDGRAEAPGQVPLDLVVVPGVAFTIEGRRCGHGAGFYDTFLSRCGKQTSKIALALGLQIIDDLPTTSWDVTVDEVVFVKHGR